MPRRPQEQAQVLSGGKVSVERASAEGWLTAHQFVASTRPKDVNVIARESSREVIWSVATFLLAAYYRSQ